MGLHLARIDGHGEPFAVDAFEFVLDAAERAGHLLPHSCRDGICGTCKARLSSGAVEMGSYAVAALSEAEREQGYFLTCCSYARSDISLEVQVERAGSAPLPVRTSGRIASLQRLTADVLVVQIALPAGQVFRFRAGQYVELISAQGARRSFSIANGPNESGFLEFHIRLVEGGRFTAHAFAHWKLQDEVIVEGPRGGFHLRDDHRPVVLIASGTGFAPIKSMVLDALWRRLDGPARLYWGGRRPADLYMDGLARSWAARYPGFSYVPVVSDATVQDAWAGRRGWVHEAVMEDFPDLRGYDVYACGVPAMVQAAQKDLVARCGLAPERFFADLFLTTADRQIQSQP